MKIPFIVLMVAGILLVAAGFMVAPPQQLLALVLNVKSFSKKSSPTIKPLFDDAVAKNKKDTLEKTSEHPSIKRKRVLKFNTSALVEKNASTRKATAKQKIKLNFFPDKTLAATLKESKEKPSGQFLWKGKVENEDKSIVILVSRGENINGVVYSDQGDFEISTEDGVQVIREIDQNLAPRHLHITPRRPSGMRATAAPSEPASIAEVATIDVLAVYTSAARRANSDSTEQTEGVIESFVEDANAIFENSGILVRLQLVGSPYFVNYTEAAGGVETELDRITEPTDGFLDEIHRIRNERNADVVFFFVSPSTDDYCGMAWQLNRDNWDYFAGRAFGVVRFGCLRYHALAHEMGHLMGAAHNREDADTTPYETYGYGYRTQSIRTIMSYPCEDGSLCHLVPIFSNPRLEYSGRTPGDEETDNARTINHARDIVGRFRAANAVEFDVPRILVPTRLR